jgi:hypothetical protein
VQNVTNEYQRLDSQECAVAMFRRLTRRAGPLGLIITAFDLWRRLPPAQRRHVAKLARKHGPKVARAAAKAAAKRRKAK